MSNRNLAVCAIRVPEDVSPDIKCRRRVPWYTISMMDSTTLLKCAACSWLVQVRTVLAPAMTKQAKSKTDSGLVKAPERSTLALLASRLSSEPQKPAGPVWILHVPMYPAPLALRHVLRWVEKNSCDGSIKHDLGRNANTTWIMYFYKAV